MRIPLLILMLLSVSHLAAQSSYQLLFLPVVNINKKLPDNWKLNLKTEYRQLLKEGTFSKEQNWDYDYLFTDIALVASKKVGYNSSLAGGYQMRIRPDELAHRLIQQFATVSRFSSFRLGHRIAADQTMQSGEDTEYRFRYRLSSEFPLNGQSVDRGEYYLKASHEYVNSFEGGEYDLEIRLTPTLGYVFTDNNKTELGIEYRIDRFINAQGRNRFFLQASWYLAF